MTDEENEVYKDPKNFKALLTSPWIRIVKSMGAEELGEDEYQEMRHPETDPFFAQIKNLKVRKILKRIYQEYQEAPEEVKTIEKPENVIQTKKEFFTREENLNLDEQIHKLKGLTKELRLVFKDHCIRTLCSKTMHFNSPRSPKAV